jgi:ribosomal protein L40E
MGLLLKIILFGIAVYAVWKTFSRWKGLWDKFVGKPDEPARPAPPPPPPPPAAPLSARKVAIEETVQCPGCGAYNPASAEKCGQCGRPQSEAAARIDPGRRG